MRAPIVAILISLTAIACSGVDDPPLGGPFGGTTGSMDPNGGNGDNTGDPNGDDNGDTNTSGDDAGVTQTQDAGSTQTQDAGGTQSKDSGTQTQDAGGSQQQSAPTWSAIFNSYMKSGTKGKCNSCHSQGSSASNLYSWLKGRGYISGSSSALVDPNQSCLSWYGGNMPTNGPSSYAQAVTDMNAWAAAGAQNN